MKNAVATQLEMWAADEKPGVYSIWPKANDVLALYIKNRVSLRQLLHCTDKVSKRQST